MDGSLHKSMSASHSLLLCLPPSLSLNHKSLVHLCPFKITVYSHVVLSYILYAHTHTHMCTANGQLYTFGKQYCYFFSRQMYTIYMFSYFHIHNTFTQQFWQASNTNDCNVILNWGNLATPPGWSFIFSHRIPIALVSKY